MDITRKCFRFVVPVAALFITSHTLAEIYKCPQPDGLVKFSDRLCADGKDETIALLENSPLDNRAERANIARYNQQRTQRKSVKKNQQVVLIEDAHTSERNAKITVRERSKKSRNNKAKNRQKQKAAKKYSPRLGKLRTDN